MSYTVKGTGFRKERPSAATNLLWDLNKLFTFMWVIRKMEIMKILMLNQWHKMYLLKSFWKATNARTCVTLFIAYVWTRCWFFNRDLFVVISYGWDVFLCAPFVNSSEILKKEKQWMLSKRCLVSCWKSFDLVVSKQTLNNTLYFLGPLSQIHETLLTKWRTKDFSLPADTSRR